MSDVITSAKLEQTGEIFWDRFRTGQTTVNRSKVILLEIVNNKKSEKVLAVSGYFLLCVNQRSSLVSRFHTRDACQMR